MLVRNDVPYRADGDAYARERCRLDVRIPASATDAPLLVWFHGGGLEGGDKAEPATAALAQRFAGDGIGVVCANYRLSPRVRAPAYIEDAAAAVAWTVAHAHELGGDPRAVFIGGHSAGGYLAALLGTDASYLEAVGVPRSAIAGVIPVSGQTTTHFTIRKEDGVPDPERTTVVDRRAPCYHAAAARSAPPFLLLCGDRDWPARAEENRYLLAMLRLCGIREASYAEIADRDHGTIIDRMVDADDPGARAIASFIAAHRSTR